MHVDCALFTRDDVEQLGIAPLTSVFWFSEHDRRCNGEGAGKLNTHQFDKE